MEGSPCLPAVLKALLPAFASPYLQQKYSELKGIPVEKKEKKKKADGEGEGEWAGWRRAACC